ncbi:MAG: 50S ribosomal protein L9 [Planctomycetota bacterium]
MPKKIKKQPKTVKLLLNESVKALGRVGDVVEVSPGYARNYLVPHHIAVQPTPTNLERVEEKRQEVLRQEAELREQRAAMLSKMEGLEIALERRANEMGHLFGSVTASDVAAELRNHEYAIDAEDVNLLGRIDEVGRYDVEIRFADDLKNSIRVYVAPDPDSKAAMEEYEAEKKAREEAEKEAEERAAAAAAEAAEG